MTSEGNTVSLPYAYRTPTIPNVYIRTDGILPEYGAAVHLPYAYGSTSLPIQLFVFFPYPTMLPFSHRTIVVTVSLLCWYLPYLLSVFAPVRRSFALLHSRVGRVGGIDRLPQS